MERETITAEQQAEQLWGGWGADAFAVAQRCIDNARDSMMLDDARYWLDVETWLYTLSGSLRVA